ncbi:hypothetical protein M8J76_008427 [Diaphorina citri]|nr:hypothetical protein M8J75_003502 [Diaphorina citri]KAI5729960.1 hypothetical protein M8J76_008427 [Diaphorina citri]KAI5735523.1 hypothetical protein M8J77_019571 [Diaphorina citri]
MDVLPSGSIFRELQDIHDTGYFSAQPSLEDHFQQSDNVQRLPIMNPVLSCPRSTDLWTVSPKPRGLEGSSILT